MPSSSYYYNIFSDWTESQLVEYLCERGGQRYAPGSVPLELLRAQCAEYAEKEARYVTAVGVRDAGRGGGVGQGQQGPLQLVMPPAGGPKKKAFVCGINYIGTRSQLSGCINDARCMHYLLRHRLGFHDENILFMSDDHPDPMRRPTKANILQGMTWLMTGLQAGDSLVFHYSGHGSQQRDHSGTEMDGLSETLVPLDSQYAGQIPDDLINQILVRPLPNGVKLHAIIDSCHSGSMLDLPYMAPCTNGMLHWVAQYANSSIAASKSTSGGFAVQFSASQDHEYAADTSSLSGQGVATGAATFSFIQALERRGLNISYGQLVIEMYTTLMYAGLGTGAGGYQMTGFFESMMGGASRLRGQTPSMSANYAFDFNAPFKL